MARPPKPIDLVELEKLAALHCTIDDVAGWFGVDRKTIMRRWAQPKFREVWERGQAKGRVSLRRRQFEMADRGNATMLIWLGKNYLQQQDVHQHEITGRDGAPIQTQLVPMDYSKLTDDELALIQRIAERAAPPPPDGSGPPGHPSGNGAPPGTP